ncbi:hypothetical protein C5C13_13010 [Clavibacter michiganensis]|nr:hypothetical protein C5C13_13010 [Clavibacter michiganensis]
MTRAVTESGQLLALTRGTMTPVVERLASPGCIGRARATPDGPERVTELVGLSPGRRQLLHTDIAMLPHPIPERGGGSGDEAPSCT